MRDDPILRSKAVADFLSEDSAITEILTAAYSPQGYTPDCADHVPGSA